MLARVYMRLSENAMAKINAIDPNSILAHQLSGEMMEAMNNYDGAIVQFKKAVDMAPQKPGSHYKLGDAYRGLSQWDPRLPNTRLSWRSTRPTAAPNGSSAVRSIKKAAMPKAR